jgi:hypothetical protein
MDRILYNIDSLHLIDSTYHEDDSYYIFNNYLSQNSSYLKYSYPDIRQDIVTSIANDFCLFSGKIKEAPTSPSVHSFFPLGVIRFMLHQDLSFSEYYTPRRKSGWVLEGYYWTNAMVYQIRDDSSDFSVHELTLFVDQVSVKLLNLKDPSSYVSL